MILLIRVRVSFDHLGMSVRTPMSLYDQTVCPYLQILSLPKLSQSPQAITVSPGYHSRQQRISRYISLLNQRLEDIEVINITADWTQQQWQYYFDLYDILYSSLWSWHSTKTQYSMWFIFYVVLEYIMTCCQLAAYSTYSCSLDLRSLRLVFSLPLIQSSGLSSQVSLFL